MRGGPSCALASQARGEPAYATASYVRRWILLEQPGPWGRDAVLESRLPKDAAERLQRRARRLDARILLLRRPGRSAVGGPVAAYVAVTLASDSWIESFTLDRAVDVLDLDLNGLARGDSVGGTPADEPLFLVCTNGRHDPCCAQYGRPLAAALGHALGEAVWECSHIGGDRFAANLLCFPHGLYYGRVAPDDGLTIAKLHRDARIDLRHYRGCSAYPFPVQAAEYFIRVDQHLDRIDDLTLVTAERRSGGCWSATFDSSPRRYIATVRTWHDPCAAHLTCRATTASHAPRYELLTLEVRDR